ncbi:MAG: mechanosensitive ion channel family protein [Burkholderiales bacterium]|nr:mechanosensitive ion channel family protein [Burkholderiales bacterium]
MTSWWNRTEYLGNPIQDWLTAAALGLGGFVIVSAVLRLMAATMDRRQRSDFRGPRELVLKLLLTTRHWILLLLSVALATDTLDLPRRPTAILAHAEFILVGLQLAIWATAMVRFWLRVRSEPGQARDSNQALLGIFSWVLQTLVWAILLLAVLGNMGVNITAFVASLGVGGVAVALALQNILGDLFASIAIGLDKPFEVGDFIVFGDFRGTVTRIGVKTTRLQSLSGEQLIASNSELLKQTIRNYTRMQERRIASTFRVPYGASREQLQQIVDGTRAAVEADERARLDRVHLASFSESGFEFEFVYYVRSPDYTTYMDVQQGINLRIMVVLEGLGLDFAVPVRKVVNPAA